MAQDVTKARSFFFWGGEVDSKSLINDNVVTGDLQRNLVVVDMDKKQTKTELKPGSHKRNVAKLRDEQY